MTKDNGEKDKVPFSPEKILAALKSLLDSLPNEPVDGSGIKASDLKRLRYQIEVAIGRLQALLGELDPVKPPKHVLDPSDPKVFGKLIAETLLLQERHPLASIPKFYGSGVYAIYYNGAFDAYAPLIGSETPIYVGMAAPSSPQALTSKEQGTKLFDRLNKHATNIEAASNLEIKDFEIRYLCVTSSWEGTAELYLINRFRPIWNKETKICQGFGKHGDSTEKRGHPKSSWDMLHPGRKWAVGPENVSNKYSVDEIKAQIADHFVKFPPTKKL